MKSKLKQMSQTFLIALSFGVSFYASAQNYFFNPPEHFTVSAEMDVRHSESSYVGLEEAFVELVGEDDEGDLWADKIVIHFLERGESKGIEFRTTEDSYEDACGSLHYFAEEVVDPGVDYFQGSSPNRRVELIDHSQRRCRDFRPFQWELFLSQESLNGQNAPFPELILTGNPE